MNSVTKYWLVSLLGIFCVCFFHGSVSGSQPFASLQPEHKSDLPNQLGSISGKVTNQNGEPLPNIEVNLYSADYWIYSSPRAAISDENGNYKVSFLPTGFYRLQFHDPNELYATQFYTSAASYQGAAEITVLANHMENVNISLQPGGRFKGNVFFGDELFKASGGVSIYVKEGPYWGFATSVDISSTTGTYETGALRNGTYRLCADGFLPGTVYTLSSCGYNPNQLVLPAFDLSDQEIKEVTIDLDQGQMDGEISGKVTGNGHAMAGFEVRLYDGRDFYQFSTVNARLIVSTTAEGKYAFTDLGYGDYFLEASDPAGVYAAVLYTNDTGNAQSIFEGNNVTTDINIDIPLAGSIAGTVRRQSGALLENVNIFVAQGYEKPGVSGDKDWRMTTQRISTNEQGQYVIKGLQAGDYRLYFVSCQQQASCLPSSYYGIEPRGLEAIIELTVRSGEAISDVDITLGSGVFLPLVLR